VANELVLLAAILIGAYFIGSQLSDNPVVQRLGKASPLGGGFSLLGCGTIVALFAYALVVSRWYVALTLSVACFALGAIVFSPLGGPVYRFHAAVLLRRERARRQAAGDADGVAAIDDLLRRLDEPAPATPPAQSGPEGLPAERDAPPASPHNQILAIAPEARDALAPLLDLRGPVLQAISAASVGPEQRRELPQRFELACAALSRAHAGLTRPGSAEDEVQAGREILAATVGMQKCWGTLRGLGGEGGRPIGAELERAFEQLAAPLRERLEARAAQRAQGAPGGFRRAGEHDYVLGCAFCSRDAERLTIAGGRVTFTRSPAPRALLPQSYPETRAARLFGALEAGGVAGLDDLLGREFNSSGVFGYCPDCARMYCDDHYAIEEDWSGSWLEAVQGICPRGHRREVA
jgi:hypothetical protein